MEIFIAIIAYYAYMLYLWYGITDTDYYMHYSGKNSTIILEIKEALDHRE